MSDDQRQERLATADFASLPELLKEARAGLGKSIPRKWGKH
jgi:hypothetical protein